MKTCTMEPTPAEAPTTLPWQSRVFRKRVKGGIISVEK